jgi:hypothetical protein
VATSLAGILSNPLFSLSNSVVAKSPMLRSNLVVAQPAQTDLSRSKAMVMR